MGLGLAAGARLGPGAAHPLVCAAVTASLWNFGALSYVGAVVHLLIATHHGGTVIPLVYQATEEDPTRARRNVVLFSYLWLCHGFAFLNDVFAPKLKSGERRKRRPSLQIMRYVSARA